MKKMLALSIGLLAATLANAQSKLPDLDVSGVDGYPYIVKAPAGAKAADKYGELYITLGTTFENGLTVSESVYDVAGRKAEIKANTVNKIKRWVVETPDGGIYESEVMGRTQFHYFHVLKVGANYLVFEDLKSGDTYTLPQIQAMYDAAKGTRAK